MNEFHEHELMDDSSDPVAVALREQAPAARLAPSARLRSRTLDALQRESSPSAGVTVLRYRPWMSVLAAAAVIALAFMIYSYVRPSAPVSDATAIGGHTTAPGDGRAGRPERFVTNTTARLASLTRPLEREAQALQSDLKRVADRFRNAMPKADSRVAPKPRD